jgi:hypothetical protein
MRHCYWRPCCARRRIAPGAAQNAAPGRELESTLTFETDAQRHHAIGLGRRPDVNDLRRGDTVHSGRWRRGSNARGVAGGQPFFSADSGRSPGLRRHDDRVARVPAQRERQRHSWVCGCVRTATHRTSLFADDAAAGKSGQRTSGWICTRVTVSTPSRAGHSSIFGVLLGGTGKVWADDCACWSMASRCGRRRKAERPKRHRWKLEHQNDAARASSHQPTVEHRQIERTLKDATARCGAFSSTTTRP